MDEELRNERCYGCLGASFGDCQICMKREAEKEKHDSRKRGKDRKGKRK